MSANADKLVADYLKRLNAELRGLPRARRRELVEEISEHIAAARSDLPTQSEAELRTLLDRLGDPADIATEAHERFGVQPARRGFVEVAALILLPVGGVVLPVIGWFVGVVLLWISDAWSTRDKLVGTFVIPGGLLVPLGLLLIGTESGGACVETSTGPDCVTDSTGAGDILVIALVAVLLLAPLATSVYLARRLKSRPVSLAA